MSFVIGLSCRECGRKYPNQPVAGCEDCFAPLKVEYDYEAIGKVLTRELITSRSNSIWRYRELLPIDDDPKIGLDTGFTPMVRAGRLGKAIGMNELYIKNDAVNFPTLSFKDRVTAIAVNKAIEFGLGAVGCASTGNLANSLAANAAAAGLPAWILIPDNLEPAKVAATSVYNPNLIAVHGNYDDVNRLCSQIADRYGWGFVNVNLRPYYGDGSKSMGYEIAEQLNWEPPDAVIVPMAGGSLITKVMLGMKEFEQLGLLEGPVRTRIFGAQATGCNPISAAVKRNQRDIRPVKPDTIAKSLAIGSPADGYYAAGVILESGGWAEDVSDQEIVDNIRLLAETEGVFTETAGGVALGVTRKLIAQGRIQPDDRTVLVITGNGLKTQDALTLAPPTTIDPKLAAFDAAVNALGLTA
jgi:threonine synthase